MNVKALPETAASRIEHYYATVQGLKKAQLKTALHDIIQPAYVLSYGGKGEGYTWSGFVRTDNLDNGHIRDRYSNIDRTFKGLQAVDGMNIGWGNSLRQRRYPRRKEQQLSRRLSYHRLGACRSVEGRLRAYIFLYGYGLRAHDCTLADHRGTAYR